MTRQPSKVRSRESWLSGNGKGHHQQRLRARGLETLHCVSSPELSSRVRQPCFVVVERLVLIGVDAQVCTAFQAGPMTPV